MAFAPIEQAITNTCFRNLRLIATDMDGTLTTQGKFTASLLHALEDLSAADIPVLIVTGRSAGWVSGLATYPSSVTLRKHLHFLNSRAFVYEAIARFFSNNKYSHQVFLIG